MPHCRYLEAVLDAFFRGASENDQISAIETMAVISLAPHTS